MNFMLKLSIFFLLGLFTVNSATADPPRKKKKNLWQTWPEVNNGLNTEKKPLLIDVYTNWCHYCKLMDATTYNNDSVYNYLKKNYYRYKFNAETKDTLIWQNKQYVYNNRYEVHDFAVYLSRGNIVYPTTVIITPGGQPYYQFGQLKPGELEMLLKYFSEKQQTGISLEEYAKSFKPTWK
ncbi:MAG TPA: thioredoxin family protein [Segetibacter sp.]